MFEILTISGVVDFVSRNNQVSPQKISEMKNYVRIYLQHNKPKSLIKKNLIDVGWDPKLIENVLNEFNTKHYSKCEHHHSFFTRGKHIYGLRELLNELRIMDEEHYSSHVTQDNNDFSNWVYHVFEDANLAEKLYSCSKDEAIQVLEKTLFK